jgi:hypothetical protein
MPKKLLRKKHISAALHKSAGAIPPSSLTCQSILAGVMPEAVREGRVSYGAACEEANNLARKKNSSRSSGAAVLSLVVVAVLLLLFVLPGQPISIIPEDETPLAKAPTMQIEINCQKVEGGYVHVRINGSEEVSWQSIYALDQNGLYIAPYAIYPEFKIAVFAPPEDCMIIYVPMVSGMLSSCEYTNNP